MNNVGIVSELFIGVPELKTIADNPTNYTNNFIKAITLSPGIIKKDSDVSFDNLKAYSASGNLMKIKPGTFIDSNGSVVTMSDEYAVSIPVDGSWYYYAIKNAGATVEPYKVSINTAGHIETTNGNFTTKLRTGEFATKVFFPGSVLNSGEYEVVSVINDNLAYLGGSGSGFVYQTQLDMQVMATRTPGAPSSFYPLYIYDRFGIISSTSNSFTSGLEFPICRAKYVGSTLTIEDLRDLNIFKIQPATTSGIWQNAINPDSRYGVYNVLYRVSQDNKLELRGLAQNSLNDVTLRVLAKVPTSVGTINPTRKPAVLVVGSPTGVEDVYPIRISNDGLGYYVLEVYNVPGGEIIQAAYVELSFHII